MIITRKPPSAKKKNLETTQKSVAKAERTGIFLE